MTVWLAVAVTIVATAIALAALTWRFPSLLRPMGGLVVHTLYRLTVYHRARIPPHGGVLLVANHVSYIDWLVFWLACPRPLTFVLWASYYRHPLLRFFLAWVRHQTIRIPDDPKAIHAVAAALRTIAAALDAGRVVLLFPEGALTRTGQMLPFRRGIEHVLKLVTKDVTIIPAATCGLWYGFFSYGGGPPLGKLPKAFRPRVGVLFGQPLRTWPPAPIAANLRLLVQECLADLAILQSDYVRPVHRRFVRNAVKFRRLFRPAIIDHSAEPVRTLSWGKLLVAAWCVTRYLRPRLGDAPNVGVWLPTGLGGMLTNLALAFLGKTSVNLNYTAGPAAVRSALQQAGVRVVITAKRFTARVPLELPQDVQPIVLEEVLTAVSPWERIRTFLTVLLLPGWVIERFLLGLHRHPLDHPLTIIFSSGSTGEPKGVVLTHRNIATNADAAIRTLEIGPQERLFGILPFFHSFGYTVCLWAPLNAPCSAVYFPDPRQAKEVGEIARTRQVTIMAATATFLRFYMRRCGPDDFRSLRLIICGAEKLPVKLQEEFRAKFGVLPLEGYGCTELSPVVSCSLPDVTVNGFYQQRNRPGCIGQPIFGVVVRAHDPNSGQPLPVAAEGVLWVKGPNVMAGYLHQPEKTAAVITNGWYNTGDAGLVEPDGFIRITGRISRFAKIAGEMVPLEKLDDEMHDLLATGGERVLAVAAVPDEKRGERVVVLYLPEIEARLNDLLAALPQRGIPNLWIPDRRDCYPVETMPVLGSGKLDLKKLGDWAKELADRHR
ncbi:MAG: AMP-binding protein [Gemmataceae bacterium]|nr:AMP-binding protein [Gemmata sp.]MDW8196534.1 AMP-binding protein [Gemmataceae bacterium]